MIDKTAERVDGVLAEGLEHHLFLGRVLGQGAIMTTLVVLSVVDIVLLIAGLAFYLFVVGGQLARVATNLEECAELVRTVRPNAEVIEAGVERINHTGRVVAGALPLLYGMAEGIVVGATPSPTAAGRRPPAGPHPAAAAPACTTVSATSAPTRELPTASGVTGVKKLTRLPSGSRNSSDRLPHGIVVGSLTKSAPTPVRLLVHARRRRRRGTR